MRLSLIPLAAAVALLAACGGGGGDLEVDYAPQAASIVAANSALAGDLALAPEGPRRASLVQAFNDNVAAFQALPAYARVPQCPDQGRYGAGAEEVRACRVLWARMTTPISP